jgi:NTP pyrophosphatase (non-canonical NTP hydrolase)
MKTFKEYQESALRTAPTDVNKDHDLLHGVLGLITEAAELADVLKKQHAYGKPIDRVNLKEELGDVLWYLPLLCRALDTDMESIAEMNIAKLKLRYPNKFSKEDAITRNLAAERRLLELESYD